MSQDDAAAQHVIRTLRTLEALADAPQTQADVVRCLGVHRRTARRLLTRLVHEGYAEPHSDGRFINYAATPRLAVLGRKVADGLDLVALGRRHLSTVPQSLVDFRFVATLTGPVVRVVHEEYTGDDPVSGSGPRLKVHGPLHATAAGKVFLGADETLLGAVLNRELLAFTPRTLVSRADLLVDLASVRTRGYANEDGEHRTGVRAVASGVVDHAGRTVAALCAIARQDVPLADVGPLVGSAAQALSEEIGAPADEPSETSLSVTTDTMDDQT